MKKPCLIAVSVTTEEAFRLCLVKGILLIAVENPLYTEVKNHWTDFCGIADYEFTEYPNLNCALLKKTRGENIFDQEKYEIYYFPLNNL